MYGLSSAGSVLNHARLCPPLEVAPSIVVEMTKKVVACIDDGVFEVNVSAQFNLRDTLRHDIGQEVVFCKTDTAEVIHLERGAIPCRHHEADPDECSTASVLYLITHATFLTS